MIEPRSGAVGAELRAEFPGLRVRWAHVPVAPGSSPAGVRRRLAELSNRYRGAGVIAMRSQPVAQAFRTFYRQIGLDPDVHRIPSEAAAVARLLHGGFQSIDLISDAPLIALLETGVPVWAIDGDAAPVESLELRVAPDRAGSLVIADGDRVLSILFDAPAPELAPRSRTRSVVVYAVAVDGVPEIHLQEAMWVCLDLLAPPR